MEIDGETVETVSDFIFLGSKITICGNFGAQENKICHCFHLFPFYLPLSDKTGANVEFQTGFFTLHFHPHQEALSFSFTLCRYRGIICISEVVDIPPSKLDSSWCFIQPGILCDVLFIEAK